jgi:chorismate mutase
MITGIKRTLLFVVISAAIPYFTRADERGPLTILIDASAKRLELGREVALAKWDDGAPVEDVARERQVIDAAIKAGRAVGLPPELVGRFFSAQIEANKLIQYALLTKWQGQGKAPWHSPIDLARTVRPQIDDIQAVLISALVNRSIERSRVSCRAELAGAIQDRKRKFPELTGCLFSIALERALGPLCDGAI